MKKKRWAKTKQIAQPNEGECEECGKKFIWGNGAVTIYLNGDMSKCWELCSNDCVNKTSARLKELEQIWDAL